MVEGISKAFCISLPLVCNILDIQRYFEMDFTCRTSDLCTQRSREVYKSHRLVRRFCGLWTTTVQEDSHIFKGRITTLTQILSAYFTVLRWNFDSIQTQCWHKLKLSTKKLFLVLKALKIIYILLFFYGNGQSRTKYIS